MKNLLKKELKLCLHPLVFVILLTPFITFVDVYPHMLTYLYMTIGVFMISLKCRENNDILYSLTLPITRKDVVKARIMMVNLIQLISVVLTTAVAIFKASALQTLAGALIFHGIWNLIYFSIYYRNPQKIGAAFTVSLIPALAVMVCDAVVLKMVPVLRDNLLTPDPANIIPKLLFLFVGVAVYIGGNLLTYKIGSRKFEKLDIA